jgi:hypothetical protein
MNKIVAILESRVASAVNVIVNRRKGWDTDESKGDANLAVSFWQLVLANTYN